MNVVRCLKDLVTGTRVLGLTFLPPEKKDIDFNLEVDYEILNRVNKRMYKNLYTVDGIGFSGSSAVTDFLDEFENCTVFGGVDFKDNPGRGMENSYEVDFFRDPYSILEMEKICYNKVHRLRNRAIHDFINVVKNNVKSGISLYDDYYLNASKKFLNDIIWYVVPLRDGVLQYVPKDLSVEEYRSIAKKYLISIFEHIESKENLVFDNLMAICEPNGELLRDYFGDFKMAYVYGDPRDIYTRARYSPGDEWVPVDPDLFINFYLKDYSRFLKHKDSSIICVNFDDFCHNYDKVAKELMNFFNLDSALQTKKFQYFNPNISIKNSGMHKGFPDQKIIEYIYSKLKDYCYEG